MRIEIITIGDEVLLGETVESNSEYLSNSLAASGLAPVRATTLPDDEDEIRSELSAAAGRSDVVIVTGGLGPTVDDVTRQAAIRAFGGREEIRDGVVEEIGRRFAGLGFDMPEGYRDLARVPAGAQILENRIGAAPGLAVKTGAAEVFLLPGVPAEMKEMFERLVLPILVPSAGAGRKALRVYGLPETAVEESLAGVLERKDLEHLSIISSPTGISVYLPGDLDTGVESEVRRRLGDHLFGEGRDRLEEVVVGMLGRMHVTLSVAESVTGGMLASMIVSVPGASDSFIEGHITYSNRSKNRVLGVDMRTIEELGAVSDEVCRQMAEGARGVSGADLALATTGIAGPGGATRDKPLGLCYMALAHGQGTECIGKKMAGNREMVRLRASSVCLDMLRRRLLSMQEKG